MTVLTSTFLVAAFSSAAGAQEGKVENAAGADASSNPEAIATKKSVVVGEFSGPGGDKARLKVIQRLSQDERFEVLGASDPPMLPATAGQTAIAEMALGFEADVVILGAVTKDGASSQVKIYNGADGALVQTVEVKGENAKGHGEALSAGGAYVEVVASVGGFAPPAAEPVPEAPPAEDSAPVEAVAGRPSPLDITLGIKMSARALRYTNSLNELYPDRGYDPLVELNQDSGAMPMGRLHWYPGAHFGGGVLAHIGISGLFERDLTANYATEQCLTGQAVDENGNCVDGAGQVVEGTQTLNQTHQLWYVGLRGRVPVDQVTFGVEGGYGSHTFRLEESTTGASTTIVPSTAYTFLEFGADAEVKWADYYLGAQGGVSLVLDEGELGGEAWFPGAHGYGLRMGAHAGWAAFEMLDLIAGLEMRAYGFNFNPVALDVPTDRVAGGATDRYMSAYFALRFKLPEVAAVSAGSAPSGGETKDSGDDFDDF